MRQHEHSMFLTLTYDPKHLPENGSLNKKHFQDFMKRYRWWAGHKKIRYFHCGEYGETTARPHYHAIIFGHDFKDKKVHAVIGGNTLYTSQNLEELWGLGFCTIGEANFETAAYVARYVTKKITGKNALHHYNNIDTETGEVLSERIPEYVTMSRRPGVGKEWFDRFFTDVYPHDRVILNGKTMKPPKYYNAQYERLFPEDYEKVKAARIAAAKNIPELEKTWERLQVKEQCQKLKFKELKRNYEK